MSNRYAIVSISPAPIVRVRVVDEPTDEAYQLYLDEVGAAFRSLDRFALLFDSGALTKYPARYQRMMDRWLEATEHEFRNRWICSAFVIQSRLIRGALNALYWLNEPYYAYRVTSTEEDGIRWILGMLDKEGVAVDDEDGVRSESA